MTCCHDDHNQSSTGGTTVVERTKASIVPAIIGALIGAAIGGN